MVDFAPDILNEQPITLGNKMETTCFACGAEGIKKRSCVDGYEIQKCVSCGTGRVCLGEDLHDYSDYGAFLTDIPEEYIVRRTKKNLFKTIFFNVVRMLTNSRPAVVDYGGGAGYLVASAKKYGIGSATLVEPSEKLRRFAADRLEINPDNIVRNLADAKPNSADALLMMDVIEHIPSNHQEAMLTEVRRVLKSDGILIGKTPNFSSLNLLLYGEKDPVIAPPSHCLYFTKAGLKSLFEKHNFEVRYIWSIGFSHNAMFREHKFTPSWVEQPRTILHKILSPVIREVAGALGLMLIICGGYHLAFVASPKPLS